MFKRETLKEAVRSASGSYQRSRVYAFNKMFATTQHELIMCMTQLIAHEHVLCDSLFAQVRIHGA